MKIKPALALAFAIFSLSVGGCSGPPPAQLGYNAVRQAMQTLGHEAALPLTRFKIASGGSQSIPLRLQRGECNLLIAVADGKVSDLRLILLDPSGDIAANENAYDTTASVQFCARAEGDYIVLLEADGGRADVFFSGYRISGKAQPGFIAGASDCPRGIERLIPGARLLGRLSGEDSASMTAGCAPTPGAEKIYELELTERMNVTVELEAAFDSVLYLRTGCGSGHELACNDDWGEVGRSRISLPLDPGVYYVVVDGYAGAQGEFALTLSTEPDRSPSEICEDAAQMPIGEIIRSNISSGTMRFNASCAGGAIGLEEVRRLHLDERSRVRIEQRSDFDGVLYLRTVCDHATSELLCNDDYMGVHTSLLVAQLDAGDYFLISDTYMSSPNLIGEYSLSVERTSTQGIGVESDSCADARVLPIGERFELDTFDARDDFAGECGGAGAADVVYTVRVPEKSRLRLSAFESQFAGRISLRGACGEVGSETHCAAFPMASASHLAETRHDWIVDRGEYFLIVDGMDAGSFGKVKLEAELSSWAALGRSCREAPLLRAGQSVRGTTAGRADEHRASCAGGAQSGDQLYRLQLSRPATVELTLDAQFDGALYLRGDCLDRGAEIACNDDDGEPQRSRIVRALDRGTYYVIVDGFFRGNEGEFELRYDIQ